MVPDLIHWKSINSVLGAFKKTYMLDNILDVCHSGQDHAVHASGNWAKMLFQRVSEIVYVLCCVCLIGAKKETGQIIAIGLQTLKIEDELSICLFSFFPFFSLECIVALHRSRRCTSVSKCQGEPSLTLNVNGLWQRFIPIFTLLHIVLKHAA